MKIFITGATGFIGSHTMKELEKTEHELLVLSRTALANRKKRYITGDLSEIETWKTKLKKFKPDVAIHLAWEGIPDFSYERSVKNLQQSLNLFTILTEIGCKKIVTLGTGFECGNRVGKITEDMMAIPVNPFTAAKYSLRLMGEQLAKEKGVNFIWIRPFAPYGPGQRSGSLIPHIMRSVATKTPLTLKYPLTQNDFVYVGDVASAIVRAVAKGKNSGIYNVGHGSLQKVKDIALLVCEEMSAEKKYITDFKKTIQGKFQNGPYADISRSKQELGWEPKIDIEKGIQFTVQAFKNS